MAIRRGPATALTLSSSAILLATLFPGGPGGSVSMGTDSFTLADAARNLLLFAPLGASLVWAGIRPGRALLIGAGLSAVLETSQILIPGRYANPLDVLVNVAGVWLGVAAVRSAPRWLRPPDAGRLSLLSAVFAPVVFVATGFLFEPRTPLSPLAIQLPPDFENLQAYDGAILGAWLDGVALPNGPIRDPERVPVRLEGDYELRVDAVAAPPPQQIAALLVITAASGEVFFLAAEHDDLVLRYLTRGGMLGLETARLRLAGALRHVLTETPMSLWVRRTRGDLCVAVDDAQECSLGPTIGDGWLLLAPEVPRHEIVRMLGAVWIACVFAAVGYWGAASRWPVVTWGAAGAGLFLAPAATGLVSTPGSQFAAALAGLVIGGSLWRIGRRR